MRTILLSLLLAVPALWAAPPDKPPVPPTPKAKPAAKAKATFGAAVRVESVIKVRVGRLAEAVATSDSPAIIRWINAHDDLDVIGVEGGRRAIISSPTEGEYKIHLHSDAGGDPVPVLVVVGDPKPKPPTPVPPKPPDPGPTPPDPTPPAPVPTGPLRVLILYESEDLPKMPPGQLDALYSRKVRDALNDACASDGPVKAWRIWDKDTDASASSREWQAALARAKRPARTRSATVTVPKVVAFRAEQFAGEWPLPDGEAGMLALIGRIKGGK